VTPAKATSLALVALLLVSSVGVSSVGSVAAGGGASAIGAGTVASAAADAGNEAAGDESTGGESTDDESSDDESEYQPSEDGLVVNDQTVETGETVTFLTRDFVRDLQSPTFEWDFDGDSEVDETTDSSGVDHTFEETGTYNVTLTAVYEDGERDSSSRTVEVETDDESGGDESGGDEPPRCGD
jgi:plastocyanin